MRSPQGKWGVLLVAAALAAGGCKKKEEPKTTPAAATSPAAAKPAAPADAKPAAPADAKPPSGVRVRANDARSVVTGMMEALSAGQLDEALSYYADDHEQSFVAAPLRSMKGKQVLRDLWTRMRTSFPDARVKPRRILDGGDRWIVQAVLLGSQKGQFGPTPPTGKPVGTELVYFLDTKHGKISKSTSLSNAGAFFKQVGTVKGEHALPEWPAATEVVKGAPEPSAIELVKGIYAGLGSGDSKAADALAAPGLKVSDHLEGGKTISFDDYQKRLASYRTAFPDLTFTVEDAQGVGPYVVVIGTAKGTHKGPLGAIPASGRTVAWRFVDVVKVEGKKLTGIDTYGDMMQLMQQIATGAGPAGSLPPRKGAAPPVAPPR